ncbi:MAG: hypothetical protein HYX75_15150 [Acidobacteria bacterium]|nr:hypothetical protein [Acidobacteriota bacterium]
MKNELDDQIARTAERLSRRGACRRRRMRHQKKSMRADRWAIRAREIVPPEHGRMAWASDAAREILQDLLRVGKVPTQIFGVLERELGVCKRRGANSALLLNEPLAVTILEAAAQRVNGRDRLARVVAVLFLSLEECLLATGTRKVVSGAAVER